MTEKIPVIYASIGDREDVNVNPSVVERVGSVLRSPVADAYRSGVGAPGWLRDERDQYISVLELALLEALGDKFLTDRIREVSKDPKVIPEEDQTVYGDVLRAVAYRIENPQ